MPVVAASTPADCFDAAIEAVRIALKYMTPVILLSDGYLANGSEPWRLPEVDSLPDISGAVRHRTEPPTTASDVPALPARPETLARPWAIPGTPGLMHRIGGLEKADGTGNIRLRPREPRAHGAPARGQDRAIANDFIPPTAINGDPMTATCWCSAGAHLGAIDAARCSAAAEGKAWRRAHIMRYLNPLPKTSATC
jgi:2-oxoglutarate ferredoxin oxidoreductase subunit alpha